MEMNHPLIDVSSMNDMLEAADPPPVVLDIRWSLETGGDYGSYARGHIPGARFLHMEQDLASAPGDAGRHPLPAAADFAAAMRRVGVDNDSVVVCYDAGPGMSAARAWWLLRYFGHRAVYVLDGGLAAWTRAGLPVTAAEPAVQAGRFTTGESLAPTVDAGDVLAAARAGILLDARSRERYLGLAEPVDKVAGHIPGAVSAPTQENIGPDGLFRLPADLKARFAALGVPEDRPVTVYCGSGITAAHEILALEVAGYTAALYPGSWSHWIRDDSRPVETSAS
jgi:thiosulfate/3-mercaptopyruvate sulfurtransferase